MKKPVVAIDFETYYDSSYSLTKMGVQEYTMDERFDPYLVSVVSDDGIEWVGSPGAFNWEIILNHTWISHNAAFDAAVFREFCGRWWASAIGGPDEWNCTANMCSYFQFPRSLANAVKYVFGEEMDKDPRADMKGKTWESLAPEERAIMNNYALEDSRQCLRLWQELAHKWPEQERWVSWHGIEAGLRGVKINTVRLKKGLDKLKDVKFRNTNKIPWTQGDKPRAATSILAFFSWLRETHPDIPIPESTSVADSSVASWAKKNPEAAVPLFAMQELRSASKLHKTLSKIHDKLRPTGTIGFNLKYFGAAATGRWSGTDRLNMQNMHRDELEGVSIRPLFIPRKGMKFVIADYAQIEPRCLALLCGDVRFLDLLREGQDPYEVHARLSMGYKDLRPLKAVDKGLRQQAKARVLGLGYGIGAERFREFAAIYGLHLTKLEAKNQVAQYRASNPLITMFWRRLMDAFQHTVQARTQANLDGVTLDETEAHACYTLPSQRTIWYRDPRPDGSADIVPYAKNKETRFWGSKLCENLTQATAREVLVDGIRNIELAGMKVLWHVHDEVIVEVPKKIAEAAKQQILTLMSTPPSWAPELPIEAEATIEDCYKK